MPNDDKGEITVYGLTSCDSCRKAQRWLQSRQSSFRFHDLRKDGVDEDQLEQWLNSDFAAKLLNQRSTTWRQLSDQERALSETDLKRLLLNHPTLIKRPVFTRGNHILAVGFRPQELEPVLSP